MRDKAKDGEENSFFLFFPSSSHIINRLHIKGRIGKDVVLFILTNTCVVLYNKRFFSFL
jgi:hypothetical protein